MCMKLVRKMTNRIIRMRGPKCNKVFGVGYSKTGTTSLSQALNILGIKCLHGKRPVSHLLPMRPIL
jgi:hypothetical protein